VGLEALLRMGWYGWALRIAAIVFVAALVLNFAFVIAGVGVGVWTSD
jgi:hypothetical protein